MDEQQAEWLWKPDSVIPAEFQLLERLGVGGQGCVYKAVHKLLDRLVAIKFFARDLFAADSDFLAHFQREARVIARINHVNIVKVLQVGACSDGTPFLVYEFLEGTTLKEYLAARKTLPVQEVECLSVQLLAALAQAHGQGIVHRDLKPGNIMLMREGGGSSVFHVKLLDFGIARSTSPAPATAQNEKAETSSSVSVLGSPPYMSPEQCRSEKVDARSDYYSLACLLFECLTGSPPFVGETPLHTQYMQINYKPPLPDAGLARELNGFFKKCLAKDAAQRPQNSSDCLQELKRGLRSQERFQQSHRLAAGAGRMIIPAAAILFSALLSFLICRYFSGSASLRSTSLNPAGNRGRPAVAAKVQFPAARLKLIGMAIHVNPDGLSVEIKRQYLAELDTLVDFFSKDRHWQALYAAYYSKAQLLYLLHRHDESVKMAKLALGVCEGHKGDCTAQTAQVCTMLAVASGAARDDGMCESYALRALKCLQDSKNKKDLPSVSRREILNPDLRSVGPDCYQCLAKVASRRQDFWKAREWASKAVQASRESFGEHSECPSLTVLADVYLAAGKTAEAHELVKKMSDAAIADVTKVTAESSALSFEIVRSVNKRSGLTMQYAAFWYESHGEKQLAETAKAHANEYLNRAESSVDFVTRHSAPPQVR
jgi:serine/threonine protein kinase